MADPFSPLGGDLHLLIISNLNNARDIGAIARVSRTFANLVRSHATTLFPNATNSSAVLGRLANNDHMSLRRLQASLERVALAPPPAIDMGNLVLLVQFLNVTYDSHSVSSNAKRPVLCTRVQSSKWVPLIPDMFHDDGMRIDLSDLAVELSDDFRLWRSGETPPGLSPHDSTHREYLYGRRYRDLPEMNNNDLPKMYERGDCELVLRLTLYRHDTQCAALVFESGHGRMTNVDFDCLDFEHTYLSNEVGSMWHLRGSERQAHVGISTHITFSTHTHDDPARAMCPFDFISMFFRYEWPVHNDSDEESVTGLDPNSTRSYNTMFSHRLRWTPV